MNEKLKHTPGPWVKDYCGTTGHIKSLYYKNNCIGDDPIRTPTVCNYRQHGCVISESEQQANARLISCAPEMLEDEINSFKLLFDIWDNGLSEKHYQKMELLINKKQKLIEKATNQKIENLV